MFLSTDYNTTRLKSSPPHKSVSVISNRFFNFDIVEPRYVAIPSTHLAHKTVL